MMDTQSDALSSQRVFKKSSPNNKLTMYLSARDLVVTEEGIDRLTGVLLVDPDYLDNRKVFGQVTLIFRYGREDEEVMGLKFCNEALMSLSQLYPPYPSVFGNTPLQDALVKRLGPNAHPFTMEVSALAPPSVQLVPSKEYSGAPIGTSYDVRAYIAERSDEKLNRKTSVRMGIRVVQRMSAPPTLQQFGPTGTAGKNLKKHSRHIPKITFFTRHLHAGLEACANPERPTTPVPPQTSPAEGQSEPECSDGVRQTVTVRATHLPEVERNPLTSEARITEVSTEGTSRESEPAVPRQSEPLVNGVSETAGHRVSGLPEGSAHSTPVRLGSTTQSEHTCSDNECSQVENIGPATSGGAPPPAEVPQLPAPRASVDKPFLLSDGRICLEAELDRAVYAHGEPVNIRLAVHNKSNKTVRRIKSFTELKYTLRKKASLSRRPLTELEKRLLNIISRRPLKKTSRVAYNIIKIFVVQHVDVCMFSNGKFKNVVASVTPKEDCPVTPGRLLKKVYSLIPTKGSTKNWIALEDSYTKSGTNLASTITCKSDSPEDRNAFAIYVSYYVKVKLFVSVMGGVLSLKLPFTLMHTCCDFDLFEMIKPQVEPQIQLELTPAKDEELKPEKDGT